MKKLKLIEQYDQGGCAIACLAALTEKTYFETRQFLYDNRIKKQKEAIGLYEWDLKDILFKYFNINSKWIKFESVDKLEKHCVLYLLPIDPPKNFARHCVIYDCNEFKILDPAQCLYNNLGGYNVSNCLEIQ
jgi:hypothetical protein